MYVCEWVFVEHLSTHRCKYCRLRSCVKVTRKCGDQTAYPGRRKNAINHAEKVVDIEQERPRTRHSGASEMMNAVFQRNGRTWKESFKLFWKWLYAVGSWLFYCAYYGERLVRGGEEYRRVREICENCPTQQWDADKEACKRCGCGGRSKVILANKLRLGTEQCPDGHWYKYVPGKTRWQRALDKVRMVWKKLNW